jgi:membrane-associated phospholipid phosphatase
MKAWLYKLDVYFASVLRRFPDWVRPLMQVATTSGHPILTLSTGVLIGWFGLQKGSSLLFYTGIVIVATFVIGEALKILIHRKRPQTKYAEKMWVKSYSLPSSHSVGSVVAYGTAAYLICEQLAFLPAVCAAGLIGCWIVLIGISRAYMGAHYPSDILAGWLLGLAGLSVIVFALQPTLL